MTLKYPPGPWLAMGRDVRFQQNDKWLKRIAICETEEIASLIAKAPEMVELLRKLAAGDFFDPGEEARAILAEI